VVCSNCGAKFIILQARTVCVGAFILVAGATSGALAITDLSNALHLDISGGKFVVAALPLLIFLAVVHFRISPLFARVRLASQGETADFPLSRIRHTSGI
jgi:hypothetical protein